MRSNSHKVQTTLVSREALRPSEGVLTRASLYPLRHFYTH